MPTTLLLLGWLAAAAPATMVPHSDLAPPNREAEALYARAFSCLQRNTHDYRQRALRDLEEAARLEPGNSSYALALAQAYFAAGYYHAAREGFGRLAKLEPSEAAPHLGLGLWWRHDWRDSGDSRSLGHAVDELMSAAWLQPYDADAWLLLVPLYLEQGKTDEAASAAFAALQADSRRLEAHLAVAATVSHLGLVQVADSIFRATIPQLPLRVRARYESAAALAARVAPVEASSTGEVGLANAGGAASGDGASESFTAADEARLETWAGLTESALLTPDPRRGSWSELADRSGRQAAPAVSESAPVGRRLRWDETSADDVQAQGTVLEFPDLGIRMELFGRLLALRPDLPDSRAKDAAPLSSSVLGEVYTQVLVALGENGR